jgi:hypothetical protein
MILTASIKIEGIRIGKVENMEPSYILSPFAKIESILLENNYAEGRIRTGEPL